MSDEMIIRHGSPTLAGLKTGNLFNCCYSDKKELMGILRSLNRRFVPKGVCIIPLRLSEEFPHEIGLFLDYPLEDVKGFIENRKIILQRVHSNIADIANMIFCLQILTGISTMFLKQTKMPEEGSLSALLYL